MTAPAFTFATAARVVFGPGRVADLPALVAGLGSRAWVCTGGHPDRHAQLLAALTVPYDVLPVRGEPSVDLAVAAVEAARGAGADVVVAIGGGSVLDLGKAVAALQGNGGDPLDYLEVVGRGAPLRNPAVPLVAVPTTAGTGAEVTANAVLAVADPPAKVSMRSPHLLPRVALVDPVLTLDCPPGVTASSGMDALTQCLEPYVTPYATPLTDGFAREGMRRAGRSLRRVHADGSDLVARTDLALCALLGGLALANAKLGAVHGLAGVVGAVTGAPHGAVCAALLAPVVEANLAALRSREPESPALPRYGEAARLLTGRDGARPEDGVEWVRETLRQLGVPGLSAAGLGPGDVAGVVAQAQRASSMRGNPADLTDDELAGVLATAM